MQAIKTLSVTSNTIDWLQITRHPRILHVFDQASNLINEHRDVLSIVTTQIGNGPFNLVVENKILFSEYLEIESPISIVAGELTVGAVLINIKGTTFWNPRPDWEQLNSNKELIFDGLRSCISSWESNRFDSLSQGEALRFSDSLVAADRSTAKALASKLAGLGQGLTPSGDDFMMGALLAAWIIHPLEISKILAEEIANTAAPLTTSLSAAWLRSAGRGEAGILWHQFFDALLAGERSRIQEAMDKILAVGETSGADALMGFINTFESWVDSKFNYRLPQQ